MCEKNTITDTPIRGNQHAAENVSNLYKEPEQSKRVRNFEG